jgi:hypothetical protein
MPDLLLVGDVVPQRRQPPRRVRPFESVSLPSPNATKELFVAIRNMVGGEFLTANLSRAVVENVRQSEVQEWPRELAGFLDDESAWEVIVSARERETASKINELTDRLIGRLESILRDAEYHGRLREVIDSFGKMVAEKADESKTAVGSFLGNARRLDKCGQTDTALDIIFDQIDEMLLAGEFDRLNQLLIDTDTKQYSVDLLLGILTATLPAKDRLPSRTDFFPRVEQTLRSRGELKEGLLIGLD